MINCALAASPRFELGFDRRNDLGAPPHVQVAAPGETGHWPGVVLAPLGPVLGVGHGANGRTLPYARTPVIQVKSENFTSAASLQA